jgi:hypothetical protein
MERVAKSASTIERPRNVGGGGFFRQSYLVSASTSAGGRRTLLIRYVGRWNIVQDHAGRIRTELAFFADGTGAMYEVVDSQPESGDGLPVASRTDCC